ncbi:MAG: hypothetical protein K2N66_00080, partial [Paramuribaculum sp.]|nr:hypothetical protein [Paramuribaculum sp.]
AQYGARPLKRAIQKYLEDELAQLLLDSDELAGAGGVIEVGFDADAKKITMHHVTAQQQPDDTAEATEQ